MTGFIGTVIGIAFGILSLNLLAGKRKERQTRMNFTPPPPDHQHAEDDRSRDRRVAVG